MRVHTKARQRYAADRPAQVRAAGERSGALPADDRQPGSVGRRRGPARVEGVQSDRLQAGQKPIEQGSRLHSVQLCPTVRAVQDVRGEATHRILSGTCTDRDDRFWPAQGRGRVAAVLGLRCGFSRDAATSAGRWSAGARFAPCCARVHLRAGDLPQQVLPTRSDFDGESRPHAANNICEDLPFEVGIPRFVDASGSVGAGTG
uniref:(northern house mosquito) hypothetical protein n=1 Tax=Culex pipiens TaxID=7175 RepID=A0A8D8K155_CULPI